MKKLIILGTAAAEGMPAMFCRCGLCTEARIQGGKNLRTRTGIIIGDTFKIDFPPDTYTHMLRHSLELGKLEYLLITHDHSDHFDAEEFEHYNRTSAHLAPGGKPLQVYFNQACSEHILRQGYPFNSPESMNPVNYHIAEPFQRVDAGELYFTPLPAQHAEGQQCLNYFIEVKNGKNIFYGMDAKRYPPSTQEFLKNCRIDLCICDATHLFNPCTVHMEYGDVTGFYSFLKENGVLTGDARFIANHFSHNGNNGGEGGCLGMLHENLERVYSAAGIEVAYDGMEFDV